MKRNHVKVFSVLLTSIILLCLLISYTEPAIDKNVYRGLKTVEKDSVSLWICGLAVFERQWDVKDGLGPFFNDNSCVGCHNYKAVGGGGDIEHSAIHTIPGINQGGSFYPQYIIDNDGHITQRALPVYFSRRRSPSLFGLGILDKVTDQSILQFCDSMDLDQDGISGRAIFSNGRIGRFGWKARISTLREFIQIALENEMGIASGSHQQNEMREISETDFNNLFFFVRNLGYQDYLDASVAKGKQLFTDIGCGLCHRQNLTTDDGSICNPYTDLLLHDMGRERAELFKEGQVSGSEFRTAPLWNLENNERFMHDGKAGTVEEAILFHNGEGKRSRLAWQSLSYREQKAVLLFLKSL